MVQHRWFGITLVGLLTFRLVWGFIGPETARFSSFLAGPKTAIRYLQGHWQGVGHNPLGGYSILAMLLLFGFQVTSGLFSNDDIAFEGPLFAILDKDTSDWITGWHTSTFELMIGLILLHLSAILYYSVIQRQTLIKPMFTGRLKLTENVTPPNMQTKPWALTVALGIAALVTWLAAGGTLPPPTPPAPTPDW